MYRSCVYNIIGDIPCSPFCDLGVQTFDSIIVKLHIANSTSIIKKIENFKRRIGIVEKATKQEGIAWVVV